MATATMERRNTTGLRVGGKAPEFTLSTDEGKKISLSGLRGKKVILYFYPKDNTPGCTRESCGFRDNLAEIKRRGGAVLGVSTDSVPSHKGFKQKYALNFPLLSDSERKVVNAYGIWKQKSLYGRKYMGLERTTFLINEQGKIEKVFPKVQVEGHVEEVLAAL